MRVIIVGGGKTGSQLAIGLLKAGHEIKVIESDPGVLACLASELPQDCIHSGDGTSPTVLEQAGIAQADVLAAVTRQDKANLVVATLGRFAFYVPRIIARVNHPKNAWLFTPEMGVDVALNQADILSHLIVEDFSVRDVTSLLKLHKQDYSILEEIVHPGSCAAGKTLSELVIPKESLIAAIIRKGKLVIPHGDSVLLPEDEVVAVVKASKVVQLLDLFKEQETNRLASGQK